MLNTKRFTNMQIHYFIPILICVLVLNMPSIAQTKQEEIQAIRVSYNQINEERHFTTKKLENEEYLDHMPDGGGELTGYYKGDTLYKITDWIGISSGVIKDEYYFDKGRLIFFYEVQSRFGFNDTLQERDYSKQKVVFERRYYIHNGILIHSVKSGKSFETSSNLSNAAMQKELLDEAKQYSSLLKVKGRRG